MKTKFLLPYLFLVILSGCSSRIPNVIINPVTTNTVQPYFFSNMSFHFQVNDHRENKGIAEIKESGEPTYWVKSTQPVAPKIENQLREYWQSGHATLNPDSPKTLTVNILRLSTHVLQKPIDFRLEGILELQVVVKSNNTAFKKTYVRTSKYTNSLKVDANQIETETNRLIEKVLNDLLKDPELRSHLKDDFS
ncbi:YajG family lipoprotein [Algicola sagamiensis]|uniref:YajG family lipoprotein n=1 Tax=Algicola sagamiensis TaxID=163869 RepID=UPI0003AA3C4A|nr:YajG family lipoprotein [Algicola sagamiensis]